MTMRSASEDGTRVARFVKAPRAKVYRAFLEPESVAAWLAPEGMQAQVLEFEAREGGRFRISLKYLKPQDSQRGKTSGDTDTYQGRFVTLAPDERIVEAIEFESDDPSFAGEMIMTVTLVEVDGGTEVALSYDNVPAGIRPEDNEAGTRSALEKLANLVE